MTTIIVAFAGTGKTTAAKSSCWNVLDSDSDNFEWIRANGEKIKNTRWPQNFIDHPAQELEAGTHDAVLLSAYIDLLPAISAKVQTPLIFVYPSLHMKDEFETRYRNRGNPDWLVNFLIDNFDTWITALMGMEGEHVVLQPGQYLSDVLPSILART